MTPLVRAEFPLAMPLLLAWIGIPRWMTLQHPDTPPGFSADAYLTARAALATDSKPELALATA